MGDIINFPIDDNSGFNYSTDENGAIGVDFKDYPISIVTINRGAFIDIDGAMIPVDRMRLASFLHAASVLVDSEERARAGDYIGANYHDEALQ